MPAWSFPLLLAALAHAAETPDAIQDHAPAEPTDPPSSVASSPEPSPDAEADTDTETPDAPPVLEVVLDDPGRGRGRLLRVQPSPGDRWQMQVARSHVATVEGERIPGVSSTVDALVTVEDDRVLVTPTDILLDGASPFAMAAGIDAVRAIASTSPPTAPLDPLQRHGVRADPTGLDEVAAELVGDLTWTLAATALPWPEARVGPGARWHWTIEADEGEASLGLTWTATLVSASRHAAEVSLALTSHAAVPGEVVPTLSADGTVWVDLRRPLARAARLTLHATAPTVPSDDTDASGSPGDPATLEAKITIATRDAPASTPSDG